MNTIPVDQNDISDLQREVATRIVAVVQDQKLVSGTPLRESVLARDFAVSRTPVRAALEYLCRIGVVTHLPKRGYVLTSDADNMPQIDTHDSADIARRAYNTIIDDYFKSQLSESVTEAELMRRYDIERNALVGVLNRLAADGLVKPNSGYGWTFEPLQKSRKGHEEDYFRFRLVLEPAVLLEPTFVADPHRLIEARDEQDALLKSIDTGFDIAHLYESNERFHVMLIEFCNNRFIANALKHPGPVQRVSEYRHYQDRERIKTACQEHICIIAAVLAGEMAQASLLMRAHIAAAQRTGQ